MAELMLTPSGARNTSAGAPGPIQNTALRSHSFTGVTVSLLIYFPAPLVVLLSLIPGLVFRHTAYDAELISETRSPSARMSAGEINTIGAREYFV